jgi:hypothetical protein
MGRASYSGGCLCGQVRWRATAEPANVRACHCRECQRWTGAPFFARAIFQADAFERAGDLTSWPTSPRIDRRSCARCGTPMFADPKDPPARFAVSLATMDDPDALRPQAHIWTCEKLDWLVLADGLPQYEKGAPR